MDSENIVAKKILSMIAKNRISSVEVADALGKQGVLSQMKIFNPGHFKVGKVKYVYTYNESNYPLHEQIVDVEEDYILYVDAFNCEERAIFGDLICKYLLLYKKLMALVVNGYLRDAHRLRKENYPIWLKGVTPLGCFNKKVEPSKEIEEEALRRMKMFDGGIMVCDDSGCTFISKEHFIEDTLKKLDLVELQEDIWYYCIDTLKWSTFDTVCLKKYMDNKFFLPDNLKEKLLEIEKFIKF